MFHFWLFSLLIFFSGSYNTLHHKDPELPNSFSKFVFPKASFLDELGWIAQKGMAHFYEKPKRFYFLHIPKTGGTSLHSLLENKIDLEELYPPRRLLDVNSLVKHQLVSGHLPYWACKRLDKDFESSFKVTILRNPVERYLSALRYKKRNLAQFHGWDLSSIHEYEQQHVSLNIDMKPNSMCRFLANNPNLTGRELLESAKQTLNSLDSVLFLENFEEDLKNLCQRTGIRLEKQDTPHLNTTIPEEVDKEFLEVLQAHNHLDLELYEYAKTNLKPKNTTYQFNSPSSRKVKQVDYKFSRALNGSGWCYRENVDRFSSAFPIYRWIMDKPANIFFNLLENQDYTLDFYAQPLTPKIIPQVLINGTEIEVKKMRHRSFSKYSCKIPKELISEKPTEITFFSPKCYKYNEIYPEAIDDRKLSFTVSRIKIFPLKN